MGLGANFFSSMAKLLAPFCGDVPSNVDALLRFACTGVSDDNAELLTRLMVILVDFDPESSWQAINPCRNEFLVSSHKEAMVRYGEWPREGDRDIPFRLISLAGKGLLINIGPDQYEPRPDTGEMNYDSLVSSLSLFHTGMFQFAYPVEVLGCLIAKLRKAKFVDEDPNAWRQMRTELLALGAVTDLGHGPLVDTNHFRQAYDTERRLGSFYFVGIRVVDELTLLCSLHACDQPITEDQVVPLVVRDSFYR